MSGKTIEALIKLLIPSFLGMTGVNNNTCKNIINDSFI
jgi:hypothetical protein